MLNNRVYPRGFGLNPLRVRQSNPIYPIVCCLGPSYWRREGNTYKWRGAMRQTLYVISQEGYTTIFSGSYRFNPNFAA